MSRAFSVGWSQTSVAPVLGLSLPSLPRAGAESTAAFVLTWHLESDAKSAEWGELDSHTPPESKSRSS